MKRFQSLTRNFRKLFSKQYNKEISKSENSWKVSDISALLCVYVTYHFNLLEPKKLLHKASFFFFDKIQLVIDIIRVSSSELYIIYELYILYHEIIFEVYHLDFSWVLCYRSLINRMWYFQLWAFMEFLITSIALWLELL